jgi:hypothetical protein
MADNYAIATVTVFGAGATTASISGIASTDMIGIELTDNVTVTEQLSGVGEVSGAVASDARDDVTLTFYPIPVHTGAPTAAQYKAITLPDVLATVVVERASGGVASRNIPTRTIGTFRYMGNGSMDFTADGMLRMSLPCKKYEAGI